MTHPVYLVDDDDAVRRALSLLLSTVGFSVLSFPDPRSFLAQLDQLEPGCIILDIRMPVISGLKLQQQLRDGHLEWPIVVISGHGDIAACRQAFRQGAVDFLSKPVDEQDLIDAIQRCSDLLEIQLQTLAEIAEVQALLDMLTGREAEVLDRIAQGFTTRQIAEALGLSPRTVESHRSAIGAKLGTTSQAEMTRFWMQASASP
ncbi:response regulator transcription factor [uncultured Ruegeria sp.]|uniref:response regulator transcription factor n=1 Tax=uncultured Ruegeria sp. TaxID=259304 RepID=UPI0026160599|nr:response regulator [uncultured Ruegeria sp.]